MLRLDLFHSNPVLKQLSCFVCACVVQQTCGNVFRGLCDRICSCLALLKPNEICIDAEEN